MQRRSGKKDFSQDAFSIVQELTGDAQSVPEKNPAAVALGKLGGAKGGRNRAANMTPEQRKEAAKKAAAARWGK